MLIPISEITVSTSRREPPADDVRTLADSIAEIGLLNPITVDCGYTLIAGLHRLEAVKLLGWTQIECIVSELTGLQAELAEIDENLVRAKLDSVSSGTLLMRRKAIYEKLHPETKRGISQAIAMNLALGNNVSAPSAVTSKSFVSDTSEKTGISERTIEENLQLAKDLTPETKEIIHNAPEKIRKKDMLKLSRLPPEQQEAAASRLAAGEIHSLDGYLRPPAGPAPAVPEEPVEPEPPPEPAPPAPIVPYRINSKHFATFEESVADLKNPNKDCSYTPDSLLAELDSFIRKFQKEFAWYGNPFCTVVFPDITPIQYEYLKQRLGTITSTLRNFMKQINRSMKNDIQ